MHVGKRGFPGPLNLQALKVSDHAWAKILSLLRVRLQYISEHRERREERIIVTHLLVGKCLARQD